MQYSDPILETVRDACARTLFLSAWADAVDNGECPACGSRDLDALLESEGGESTDYPDAVAGLRDALRNGEGCPECGRDVPTAGPGDDWADVLDGVDTPAEAFEVADRIVASLGDDEVAQRAQVDAWDSACRPDDPSAEFELDDDSAERFGHCAALQALGHGVGLSDDVRHDGRSVQAHGTDDDGRPLFAVVVPRHDGPTSIESTHPSREQAVEALRATRYQRPDVASVEFGAYDFDGGALLACSTGCRGIVPGEHGVEACGSCGSASGVSDDGRAAAHFGRLLAERGRLADAVRLLDGGRVVGDADLGAVLDLLGRAAEVVLWRDRLADAPMRPDAPFAPEQAFDDWAADLLADAGTLRARVEGDASAPWGVVLDADAAQVVAEALADAIPRAGAPWASEARRVLARIEGAGARAFRPVEGGTGRDVVAEAREVAHDLREQSDSWAYGLGDSPDPSDLDDLADLLDRCASAVRRGVRPAEALAGVRGDLLALASDLAERARESVDGDDLLDRSVATLRDLARTLGGPC